MGLQSGHREDITGIDTGRHGCPDRPLERQTIETSETLHYPRSYFTKTLRTLRNHNECPYLLGAA